MLLTTPHLQVVSSLIPLLMAHQNHQINLLGADPIGPHKFIESFIQASHDENKRFEFHLKYSVPQILALIQKDLRISVMEDLALSSSAASSSFELLHQTISHLASRHDDSEQNMPQLWKDLIKIIISDSPAVMEEPAEEESIGSKSKEFESDGVHEEQTQDLTVDHSTSVTNYSGNEVTPPDSSVSPEISVQQINLMRPDNGASTESDSYTLNMPRTPSASPPQEDNKLGFTVFAVELLGSLTNLVVSSRSKHNQVLIYVVVACSTLAFSISSTALVLHKKRPTIAKKMQKAAFLMGTFGFMGIMGMLLPSTITWCLTVSAFLVCMLMFVVASLIN